jgi:hypothetical protein
MHKQSLFLSLCGFILGLSPTVSMAQSPCPQLGIFNSIKPVDKNAICTLPELYGPNGLFAGEPTAVLARFLASALPQSDAIGSA